MHRRVVEGTCSAQLLDVYQARGAVAAYIKSLESDLKSIAASGWGPELIPDDEILQSQFPEVLEQIEKETARIAELEGLFAAASGGDEEEGEVEVDAENGVLPKSLVKSLKEERKLLAGEVKEAKKKMQARRKQLNKELFDDDEGAGEPSNEAWDLKVGNGCKPSTLNSPSMSPWTTNSRRSRPTFGKWRSRRRH